MDETLRELAASPILQVTAILVAVCTALYYAGKFFLFIGRSIWRKISPRLGAYTDERLKKSDERTDLAVGDVGFLVAETGRKTVEIVFFSFAYFSTLSMQEAAIAAQNDQIAQLSGFARTVFLFAASYNLGRVWRWYGDVAKRKREIARGEGSQHSGQER